MTAIELFEVDHPMTQEWKRQRMSVAGLSHPSNVHFVGMDFLGSKEPFRRDVTRWLRPESVFNMVPGRCSRLSRGRCDHINASCYRRAGRTWVSI